MSGLATWSRQLGPEATATHGASALRLHGLGCAPEWPLSPLHASHDMPQPSPDLQNRGQPSMEAPEVTKTAVTC